MNIKLSSVLASDVSTPFLIICGVFAAVVVFTVIAVARELKKK